ncbi:MAG: hypothetical protein ACXVCY_16370 [Pseudobdellovibrionaceae bacterium]
MTKDLLEHLKALYDPNISLLELPIMSGSFKAGSEVSLKTGIGEIISSGCGELKDTAIRICIAEAFERGLVMKIFKDPKSKFDFQMQNFPTTCGFAAGFEREKTKLRAIAEGLERWAWSQWIDNKCDLDISPICKDELSPLSKIFLTNFTEFKSFKKELKLNLSGVDQSFELFIFLGLKKNGIFPGSRVTIKGDNKESWDHSILEAYRCRRNFHLTLPNDDYYLDDIIAHRAIFFGQNKDLALEQIHQSQQINHQWPTPSISLLKEYQTSIDKVYLWRCLINDYLGWHIGNEKRFVY